MTEKKDASFSLRIPKWLKRELTKEAHADRRSLNSHIANILIDRANGEPCEAAE